MSSTTPPITDGAPVPFTSLSELRTAHIALLKRYREEGKTAENLAAIRAFLRNGQAAGVILNDTEERWSAQSILDYWVTTLYQHTQQQLDIVLADFDPREAPQLTDEDCPYLGLDTFLERDHRRFFGRTQLVAALLEHLRAQRLLVILGPSGSGKSSVALAGVMASLRQGALPGSADWRYYPRIVPGSNPLASLARTVLPARRPGETPIDVEGWVRQQLPLLRTDSRHLARLISQQGGTVTLIVDQFEEAFTLCDNAGDRARFLANLLFLSRLPGAEHRVIFTLRSDFESYLLQFPKVQPMLREATVRILPLNAAEVREAVERPAEQVGLKFDTGVVDSLIHDLLGEPAALPLLQFTLLKLWEHKRRNRVTWEDYRRLGGGRVALANSADAFYRSLLPEEQQTLQRILLRMVRPTEGYEVTSSRVRRELFYQGGEDPGRVDRVLEKLIRERLIRVTEGATPIDTQVEVAHEALVRNWPLLVEWVDKAREQLRVRYRLSRDAEDWNARGRDATLLLGETRLREAQQLPGLNRIERDFLAASSAALEEQRRAAEQARLEREQALLRELEQQQALNLEREERATEQVRANRRLASLSRILAMVAAIAVVLAVISAFLFAQARASEQQATLRALITVVRNADDTNYGLVWADTVVRTEAIDPGIKRNLSRDLIEMLHETLVENRSQPLEAPASSFALSPDGKQLLTADVDGAVRRYAYTDGNTWRSVGSPLVQETGRIATATWSPDGSKIVTFGSVDEKSGLVTIWKADGTAVQIPVEKPVNGAAWSANQQLLALSSGDDIRFYQLDDKSFTITPISIEITPDSNQPGRSGTINSLAWNPDRTKAQVLTGSSDGTIRIWEANNDVVRKIPEQRGPNTVTQKVLSVAWSPDGRIVLAGRDDGTVQLYSAEDRRLLAVLRGHGGGVKSIAWNISSDQVITGSEDRTVRVWEIPADLVDHQGDPLSLQEQLVLRGIGSPVSAVGWVERDGAPEIFAASGKKIYFFQLEDLPALEQAVADALQKVPKERLGLAQDQLRQEIRDVAPAAMVQALQLTATTSATELALAASSTAGPDASPVITSIAESSPSPTDSVPTPGTAESSPSPTDSVPTSSTAESLPSPTDSVPTSSTAESLPPPTTLAPTESPALPTIEAITNTPTPTFIPPTLASFPPPLDPTQSELKNELDQLIELSGGKFGVLAIDMGGSRTIYERMSKDSFYAASLIKLPIAMTVYNLAQRNALSLDERLTLQASDKVAGTGSLQGAPNGSSYSLRELVTFMLRESDNTASNMVLSRIGFEQVNSYMRELGATSTFVERLFFDQAAIDAGRDIRTSPHDMALLLAKLFYGPPDDLGGQERVEELKASLTANNDSYQKIRAAVGSAQVWNKTGVLSRMEHDAAVIQLPSGRKLILVVMSESTSNVQEIDTIIKLTDRIYRSETEQP